MIKINKQIIIVILAGILITASLLVLSTSLKNKIYALNQQWDDVNQSAFAKVQLLDNFYQNFGYLGFIHYFKNFLLRKDVLYLINAEMKLSESIQNIRQLKKLKLNESDSSQLAEIEKVVLEYQQKLYELQTFRKEQPSLSITEMDKIVRVKDKPAALALEKLKQSFNAIGKEEKVKIKEKLELTIYYLHLLIYFLIPVVVLVTAGYIVYILRLDKSLNEIKAIFLSSPSALVLSDQKGRILNQNKNAEDLLGYSKQDFKNMVIEDLIHSDIATKHAKLRRRFVKDTILPNMKQNKMNSIMGYGRLRDEFFAKSKSNESIPVKVHLSSFYYGKELRIISSLTDLREKKLLEENLKIIKDKSEQQLKDKLNLINMMNMTNEELQKNLKFLEKKYEETEQKRHKLVEESVKITMQKSDVLQSNARMIKQIQSYQVQIEILSEQIQSLTLMLNQDNDVY